MSAKRNSTDDDKLFSELPEFVSLDAKYTCPLCQCVLVEPVQTQCGHRYCKVCIEKYIKKALGKDAEGAILCPAKEEGCEEVKLDSVRHTSVINY